MPNANARFGPVGIRRIALITCIATASGALLPMWKFAQTVFGAQSMHTPWKWLSIPVLALASLLSAMMPVFYFALYRNEGTLRFPKRYRMLALAAAIVVGIMTAAELPEWIGSSGAYWRAMMALDWRSGGITVFTFLRAPWTIRQVSTLLGEFSNLAFILLLIAFYRQASADSSAEAQYSRLLSVVARVVFIAWGIWLAFCVVRVVLTPLSYSQIRNYGLELGRRPPTFGHFVAEPLHMLLSQACLYTAPYIVYKSRPGGQPGVLGN